LYQGLVADGGWAVFALLVGRRMETGFCLSLPSR